MTTQIQNDEEQKELAMRIGNAVLSGLKHADYGTRNPQEQFRTQFDNATSPGGINRALLG